MTDHKPLLTLFGEHKCLPTMAAARIQRWAITLSADNYQIAYRKSEDHGNADGLSRIPLPETSDAGTEALSAHIHTMLSEHPQEAPLKAAQVARVTRTDSELSRVYQHIMTSWPEHVDENLKPFYARRYELSAEHGCVLWGTRVIVPTKLRKAVLKEIHTGHQGIVKMKALARKYVWWPKLDSDIEQICKQCETCQIEQKMPRQVPQHPWEFPGECWKHLHVDFAGPFLNNMFMIIVDAHSKWLEIFRMTQITSQATITRLRRLFAAFGLPEQIVTDNATTFTSEEFQNFVRQNGILHTTSATGHPATNGLAERYVQTFKSGMKKLASSDQDIEDKLSLFLLQYRTTPNCTTGQSPADLFLRRHIRTRLDFLKPDTAVTVRRKQYLQKDYHDRHAVDRSFEENEPVYLRSTVGGGPRWIPGLITQQMGPVSYQVRVRDMDTVYRRHGDQLRSRTLPDISQEVTNPQVDEHQSQESGTDNMRDLANTVEMPKPPDINSTPPRRSQRASRPPSRLIL